MDQVLLYGDQHGTIFQLPEYRVLGCTTAGRCEVLAGTNICLVSCSGNSRKEQGKSSKESCCKFMVIREEKLIDDGERSTYVFLKAFRWDSKKQGKQLGEELHVLE